MASVLTSVLLRTTQVHATSPASTASSDSPASIFDSADGVTFGGGLLAVFAIFGGLVMCLAGFKLFRLTLFALGFVAGGTLLATVAELVFDEKSWLLTASWVAFVLGGVLCGLLVSRIYSASVFVAGAMSGVLLAVLVNTSLGYKVYPSNPELALLILALVFGILGGVLAVQIERPVLIIATSFVGAGLLVWGVGYFAGAYPSATDLKRYRSQDVNGDGWVYAIPDAWWVYLCVTLLLAGAGVLVQFKLTGRDTGDISSGSPVPVPVSRKEVVIFARYREVVEVELGTPTMSDSRSGYTIV